MAVLDLMKPGKLWASAENEETTTFYLVTPDAKYTKDKLTTNPVIAPGDQLMKPWSVSAQDADQQQGRAVLDLAASGRAKEILERLNQRFEQGLPPLRTVLGVVVVTAGKQNRIPAKHLADVIEFELGPLPQLRLAPVTDFVTVQNFKAGKRNFEIDVVTQSLGEVELTTSPDAAIQVAGGPQGRGKVRFRAEDGRKYRVIIPASLDMRQERQQVQVPPSYKRWVPGGWRTPGVRATYDPHSGAWVVHPDDVHKLVVAGERRFGTRTDTREIWQGGDVTLTATGTGDLAGIRRSIKLRAESWASAWLKGPPPPPFSHNIC